MLEIALAFEDIRLHNNLLLVRLRMEVTIERTALSGLSLPASLDRIGPMHLHTVLSHRVPHLAIELPQPTDLNRHQSAVRVQEHLEEEALPVPGLRSMAVSSVQEFRPGVSICLVLRLPLAQRPMQCRHSSRSSLKNRRPLFGG